MWLRDDLSSTLYNFLLKETETTTLTTPTTPTIPTTPPTTTPILPTPKEKLVFEWMEKSATQVLISFVIFRKKRRRKNI